MKFHWYCSECALAITKWEHVTWHKMLGHPISDYEWPAVQSKKNELTEVA
jgi:hypothetical protein